MIKFYFSLAPNPIKVALMLEETGLAYEPIPVDTRKGQQHEPAFKALNPNAKVPVIVDGDAVVFDSNAILLYLAEKTGQFLTADTLALKGELFSWLMFIASGVGPYSGQSVHFQHFAPEPKDYPIQRYGFEAERHWNILNDRLATNEFMVGDSYTIVDMAVFGWARPLPFIFGEGAMDRFPHIKRLVDWISARPAAERVGALLATQTFETEMTPEARRALFPSMAEPA
ncbi:MAG: glutathione S-transferase N-terminal domain-containing protein [Sphingomonas sp.]|jgi:GST-like protein